MPLMKRKTISGIQLKMDSGNSREFTAYGNVKNVIDHAQDRAVDGCYKDSIERHTKNGTMPSQLWGHKHNDMPVGPWVHMEEDSHGLLMRGKLSETSLGNDLYVLAKDNAIDQFSIGYQIDQEEWNRGDNCNDLIKLHIMEVSWVNFACNELSTLQDIKSRLTSGGLTKRDMQTMIRNAGFSKRDAEKLANAHYRAPEPVKSIIAELEKSAMCQ